MTPLLIRLLFIAILVFSVTPAVFVHAEDVTTPPSTLENPLGPGITLNELIVEVLQLVVTIGAIVVVLMLVYVGFMFVMARGEPGAISEARTALMWTIIGALILLGAQAIAIGIQETVTELSTPPAS
ncbi:MAG TPA: hypothetical protein VM103_01700 [Candidatus Paceibacterota bacterium]|nr:hypothetical protein [Candidatus Paceibacterota bacterium]